MLHRKKQKSIFLFERWAWTEEFHMNEAALQSGDSANQQHVVEVTVFFLVIIYFIGMLQLSQMTYLLWLPEVL